MSARSEAVANATRWAEAAERHAGVFLDARAVQDILSLAASELEEHARCMALMWAAVAALHPVELGPLFAKNFWQNAGGGSDPYWPLPAATDTGASAERAAAEDRELCTATFTVPSDPPGRIGAGATEHCALQAGHYVGDFDAKDGPHRNRVEISETELSMVWIDTAEGAVPHGGSPAASRADAASCCMCGSPDVVYRNYREQPFCWPCADGTSPQARAVIAASVASLDEAPAEEGS